MKERLIEVIEASTGDQVKSLREIAGGDIADAQLVELKSGKRLFLKRNPSPEQSLAEEHGLNELRKAKALRIPRVEFRNGQFLALEWIESKAPEGSFFTDFAEAIAEMHCVTDSSHGLEMDNYLGSTPQPNRARSKEWKHFFFEERLLPIAQQLPKESGIEELLHKREPLILELMAQNPKPSLLHGDLWSGNYMCDLENRPVLIDPAVYYGHSEAELGMTTLFGGLPSSFYDRYHEIHPADQATSKRVAIYRLYHVLNHALLFGSSYYAQSLAMLEELH